jgi:hypothetical protein
MWFDGRRWTPVPETSVAEVVRKALVAMVRSEAQAGADADRLKKLSGLLSAAKIRNIVYVAKLCCTTTEEFDSYPGLTGHPTPDDRLIALKGSGANGKTTIVDAVRQAAGDDYAVTMPERVLLARSGDHPTEMMVLRGARLALMEEFPELGHLNVKRL